MTYYRVDKRNNKYEKNDKYNGYETIVYCNKTILLLKHVLLWALKCI